MKIDYSFYDLYSQTFLNALSTSKGGIGALLRVTFPEGDVGYADCHPWCSLGDPSIEEQLSLLKENKQTRLTEQSLYFAQVDAQARREKKALHCSQKTLYSHYLLTDLIRCTRNKIEQIEAQNYRSIKIKMGRDLKSEVQQLHDLFVSSSLKIRLDFNESLSFVTCLNFVDQIKSLHAKVEWLEDPFPFDLDQWTYLQKQGWTLACDYRANEAYGQRAAAKILILKPAIHSLYQTISDSYNREKQTCIVTSYLGHPFEQSVAAYIAALIDPQQLQTHGLHSHLAYPLNPFSQHYNQLGPIFRYPAGIGFGFDRELQQIEWRALI